MENKKFLNVRWMLVLYDILIFILADLMLFVFYDPLPSVDLIFTRKPIIKEVSLEKKCE